MKGKVSVIALALLLLVGCGGSDGAPDEVQGATCPADDPDCADVDGGLTGAEADAPPDVIALADPDDPDAPLSISFSGFFYSDGESSQLCSSLIATVPPQCGDVVIEISAPLDVVLGHVAEAFGSPDDARINIDQGVYWTDNWVNLTGTLDANTLVLD